MATTAPKIVSLAALRSRVDRTKQPIYWAGPIGGRKYELTETLDGSRIYVRYLPQEARVGVQKPFLTVATYRHSNAFGATRAVSRREGATPIPIGRGGVAFYASDHPTSVYLAYPRSDYQIEVFHPRAEISHQVVRSGRVRPIR